MSEHQRETAFLRKTILYGDTAGSRELEERITRVQRDERCVQRVAWLMALLAALAAAGLGYGAVLQDNLLYRGSEVIRVVICDLGVASLICLLSFAGLLLVYRRKLNRLREECRQLITKLLEFRLGKPHARLFHDSRLVTGDRAVVQRAVEVNGPPTGKDCFRQMAAEAGEQL